MGRFVDVGKGSNRRPENRKKVLENLEAAFGDKVQAGRFKQDPETGKFISSYEWHQKYGKPVVRTHFVQGDIEPYQSPVDDRVINSRKAQREDYKRTGSRRYEGREQEAKEAQRHRDYKWKKLDETLEKSMPQVANDLKYQNIQKETRIKSAWTIGEE